jgi:hypothetical protein
VARVRRGHDGLDLFVTCKFARVIYKEKTLQVLAAPKPLRDLLPPILKKVQF